MPVEETKWKKNVLIEEEEEQRCNLSELSGIWRQMQVVKERRMRRKRQFGWESRATVKWDQSRIICSRAPPLAAAATGEGGCRGCWGELGRAAGVFVMACRRSAWVAGQGKGRCRRRQPWGMLYHHSEKARGSHVYISVSVCACVCGSEWEKKMSREPDARMEEKSTSEAQWGEGSCGTDVGWGLGGWVGGVCPASEYGGLVLGADGTPVGVPLVTEPGGAAQRLHVGVHLQGVDLPEGGGEGGGTRGGGVRRVAVEAIGATLTSPQLTHVHVD